MATDPMEAIRAAGAAARAGMGLDESDDEESVEVDSPEEEQTPEVEAEPEEEQEAEETQEETEEEAPQPRDRSVFKQFNEVRSQKREAEARERQLLELVGATTLEEAQAKMAELRASQPMSPDFVQFASELGIEDPETVKKLSDFLIGQVKKEFQPIQDQVKANADTVQEVQQQREYQESMDQFEGEWDEVLPVIESEYKPNATQLKQVKEYLAEAAHSEEYFDKELDYILYKESSNLENILGAPKRKTMLASRGQAQSPKPEGVLVKPDGSHASILRAAANLKKIANRSAFDSEDEARF